VNGNAGLTLPGVDYGVTVFATFNQQYNRLFPLAIVVGATGNSGTLHFTRYRTLTLSGPATKGVRYLQSDTAWAQKPYDDTGTIGNYGCALSCMAMIAKARGVDVNPLTLNNFMEDHPPLFDAEGNVVWNAINALPSGGAGLGPPEKYPKKKEQISPSDVGRLLDQGAFVIAKVINPNTGHKHFVLVTGRIGDSYAVLDPDGDRNDQSKITNTKLSDYSGGLLAIVVYKPK
jgi:hypothetical protein